jgi:hypothetical protein
MLLPAAASEKPDPENAPCTYDINQITFFIYKYSISKFFRFLTVFV